MDQHIAARAGPAGGGCGSEKTNPGSEGGWCEYRFTVTDRGVSSV